jgi:hypothetical protein
MSFRATRTFVRFRRSSKAAIGFLVCSRTCCGVAIDVPILAGGCCGIGSGAGAGGAGDGGAGTHVAPPDDSMSGNFN